jgi:endonuclease YncB( thermonuclease family)
VTLGPNHYYNATVVRWTDGDTVQLMVDLGFFTFAKVKCRLSHVNAPESKTPTGPAATQFSEEFAPVGFPVVVFSTKTEKWGRFLVDLYRPKDEKSLNMELLATGHAVAYEG